MHHVSGVQRAPSDQGARSPPAPADLAADVAEPGCGWVGSKGKYFSSEQHEPAETCAEGLYDVYQDP